MTSPQLQRHAAVLLGWTILLSGPAMAADAPTRTAPGILHEEVSISERQPLTVRPLRPDNTKSGTDPNDPAPRTENLIEQMDVYALSGHAHLLTMPRMVSPLLVTESARGRAHMPTVVEWDPIIDSGSCASGLDPDLIRAVIRVESNNDPRAISPKGAQGLMQLMPGTQAHLGVTDPFDPRANVEAGSIYLRRQLDTFGTLDLALAAYNAGPGNVQRHGGIPPFAETRNFVQRVLALYHGEFQKKDKTRSK